MVATAPNLSSSMQLPFDSRNWFRVRPSHLLAAVLLTSAPGLRADSGTWTSTANGTWGDSANWLNSIVADGAGNTADFNTIEVVGTDRTVSLDSSRTIGNLIFGDTTPSHGWLLNNNGSAANILTLAGPTAPTITVNPLGSGRAATISLSLAGTQGFTKDGAGTLALSGTNTLTGRVNVTAGTLALSSAGALNRLNELNMSAGATTTFNGTLANTTYVAGLSGAGSITTAAGGVTTIGIGGRESYTYGGSISNGAGTVGLQMAGTGTQTLTGASTFTGPIAANAGNLVVDYAAGAALSPSAINMGGGTLTLKGASTGSPATYTLGNLTANGVTSGAGGSVLLLDNNGNSGSNTFAFGTFTGSSPLQVKLSGTVAPTVTATTATVSSVGIVGGGYMVFTDAAGNTNWLTATGSTGAFTLGGYSSYTAFNGASTVNNELLTGSGLVTGVSKGGVVLKIATTGDGQSLDLGGKTLGTTQGILFTGANDYEIKNGLLGSTGTSATYLNIQQFGTGNLTISAQIQNTTGPAKQLLLAGPGKVTLTNTANSFAGAVNLFGGILNFNALSTLGAGSAINFGGGTLEYATGNTADISARTVTINASGATIDTNGNNVAYANAIGNSGAGGLTKKGLGTLTLSGVNTYAGFTTVNAGTLLVNGGGSVNASAGVNVTGGTFNYSSSTALTRAVEVNGGTFRHNSSQNFTGPLTFNSGTVAGTNFSGHTLTIGANQTISPGNSTGTMTSGAQTWASLGTYAWEINDATGTAGSASAGWDLLSISGDISLTATVGSKFTIDVFSLTSAQTPGLAQNFDGSSNYFWLIADSDLAITTFNPDAFNVSTTNFSNSAGGVWSVVRGDSVAGGDDSQIYLAYAAIPEPTTWALIGIAGLFLIVARRRRQCA